MALRRVRIDEDYIAYKAMRFVDTDTGETISRRQAAKQQGKPLPTQRLIDRPTGRRLVATYAEKYGVTRAEARADVGLREAVRIVTQLEKKRRTIPLNRAEAQRIAGALSILHPDKQIDWTRYVGISA